MIVAIPFYWKNPNGCHRGQDKFDCHVTGGCTGGKTTRGHPRHRNGVRDRKVERYDHQSVNSHACIGRRSSVSDLDSCGQKWIPFRTRLSERRSECATSGNWIAVRRSFGRRRSSVGRRSVGRSVEQFLFRSIVFAESAPPPHREFCRITGQVDRRSEARRSRGRQINMQLGFQIQSTSSFQETSGWGRPRRPWLLLWRM